MSWEMLIALAYGLGIAALWLSAFPRRQVKPKEVLGSFCVCSGALTSILAPSLAIFFVGWLISLLPFALERLFSTSLKRNIRERSDYNLFFSVQLVALLGFLSFFLWPTSSHWALLAAPWDVLVKMKVDESFCLFLFFVVALREGLFPFHWQNIAMSRSSHVAFVVPFRSARAGLMLLAKLSNADFRIDPTLGSAIGWFLGLSLLYLSILTISKQSLRRYTCILNLVPVSSGCFALICANHFSQSNLIVILTATILSTTGILLFNDLLARRVGNITVNTPNYLGLQDQMPHLSYAFLFFGFVCLNVPGTITFVVEDIIIHTVPDGRLFILGLILLSYSIFGLVLMNVFNHLFCGRAPENFLPCDLKRNEKYAFSILATLLVMGSFYPFFV